MEHAFDEQEEVKSFSESEESEYVQVESPNLILEQLK